MTRGLGSGEEYGVIERIDLERPQLMPETYPTEEGAREYVAWIQENNERLREQAEHEQAVGFVRGNAAWHRWAASDRPRRSASYTIARRDVGGWEEIE